MNLLGVLAAGLIATNGVANLGVVRVEADALSKYRPEFVEGATFTQLPPELAPTSVEVLTEDFIREHNPTDLHDLLRYVPGIETGGKSLLVRNPGSFTLRGQGGSEPAIDGLLPVGRGAGLFMDSFLLDRVEIVKGPVGALNGGAGAVQNTAGGGGSVNLHLKGATTDQRKHTLEFISSIGRDTWRERGMLDVNEVLLDDRLALRTVGTFDVYSPTYANCGRADGAKPRMAYSLAPSMVFKPSARVTMGLKTLFQTIDQPSYIGVSIWRGKPGAGYDWYESSCLASSRTTYESMMFAPYLEWQVNDDWRLKFGAGFFWSHWQQLTPEPFYPLLASRGGKFGSMLEVNEYLNYYYRNGYWPQGEDYMLSDFSQSSSLTRNYNFYARSVYAHEYDCGLAMTAVVQDDYYYRESTGGFGNPVSRYGLLLQDQLCWGWVTLLGGVRYDCFRKHAMTASPALFAHAVSPRGGLTIKPYEWLVFFGNVSQTRTPMLGIVNEENQPITQPWFNTQCEGGVRVRMAEQLWFTASAYRIQSEDQPITVDRIHYVSEGENLSKGVELSLSGDITANWRVLAMYAFSDYENLNADKGSKARKFARYPRHEFSVNMSYRFDGCDWLRDIVLGGGYRFRSKSYGLMTGSYVDENIFFNQSHVFDVNLTVPLSKFGGSDGWLLTLGVRNLFNERYFESSRHWYESLVGEPRTFEIGLRGEF